MPMSLEMKELVGELKTQLTEANQVKGAVEQLEQQMKGLPATIEKKVAAAHQRACGEGGRYRGVFPTEDNARSFGLGMIARVHQHAWAADALKAEYPDVAKDFTTTDGAALIPEDYSATIIDLIEQYGVFEMNAMKYPMASDRTRYPKKTGRTAAYPMDEGTAVTEGKPIIKPKQLTSRKWGAFTEISSEVDEDSAVAFGEMIAQDMAQSHALAADQAGFLGDGTSTYNSITGVVNALVPGAIVTGSGSAWADLTRDDFLAVISRPVQQTFAGGGSMARWYCTHQFFWTVMVPITLAAGGVTAGEMEGQRKMMFLGYPVEITQVMPATSAASQIPCVFGNLRMGAVFGRRRDLAVKKSEDYRFPDDVLCILSTRRFDIQVHGAGVAGEDPAPDVVEVLAGLKTAAAE